MFDYENSHLHLKYLLCNLLTYLNEKLIDIELRLVLYTPRGQACIIVGSRIESELEEDSNNLSQIVKIKAQ